MAFRIVHTLEVRAAICNYIGFEGNELRFLSSFSSLSKSALILLLCDFANFDLTILAQNYATSTQGP